MSYNNIISEEETRSGVERGEEFTPKELADSMSIDVDDDVKVSDMLAKLISVVEGVQHLQGDDSTKWYVIRDLIQVINSIDSDAVVEVTDETIKVSTRKRKK